MLGTLLHYSYSNNIHRDWCPCSAEITGNPSASMNYINYEEAIVQRYGIDLVGWTYEKFVNPSEFSSTLGPLRRLIDAINAGDCKFVKLTAEECRKRLQTYKAKIVAGELKARERKIRSDAGKKKKRKRVDASDNEDEEGEGDKENEGRLSSKRPRTTSKPFVDSDDEFSGGQSDKVAFLSMKIGFMKYTST
jgi:hypothetical protein